MCENREIGHISILLDQAKQTETWLVEEQLNQTCPKNADHEMDYFTENIIDFIFLWYHNGHNLENHDIYFLYQIDQ